MSIASRILSPPWRFSSAGSRRRFPGLPQMLVGHSMGGLISSLYLLRHQQDLAGCVLSGPAIKTDIEPAYLQLLLIRCLSAVAPGTGVLQLDASGVSRDPAVVANYVNDPLVNHGKMSARMVAELFRSMRQIQAEAGAITLPMLLLHGGARCHGLTGGLPFPARAYQLRRQDPDRSIPACITRYSMNRSTRRYLPTCWTGVTGDYPACPLTELAAVLPARAHSRNRCTPSIVCSVRSECTISQACSAPGIST